MNIDQEQLRLLPSVDELLHSDSGQQLIEQHSRAMTLQAVRASIAQARFRIREGAMCPLPDELLAVAEQILDERRRASLQPVINGTGVIINTNLGRSPLSNEALQAVQQIARGYSNLEYALEAGERGSRHAHVSALLCELTGAEAALVTNNNAAAVLLALSTLAAGREVIISRGQLVEIGGGFRVPEVMSQSGCRLIEVGTTNRTRLSDYEKAITASTALLLTVHP
ncbi:MAG TPA: L-seryl-tRNA(Sec) selenium transferase, partial [Ktedonobacteraceae bacterium]|nr:L-seryl-tRNA(Sec) selenium transferase [Ktedonobacteraceae bacterium]